MNRRFGILLALFAFLASSSAVRAEDKLVVKMGTVAPEGTPWAKQVKKVRKYIKKKSGGSIKVKVYTGFAKGGEKSIVRRCVQGSLHMCGVTVGALATVVNDLALLELPYLFKDSDQADRILDGPALDLIKKILEKKGLVFYGWSENGWRGFGTKDKEIRSPKDMVGLKMRAQESKVHVLTYKALGALPVPIALPEVVGALQTGVVDGYDNTPLYLFAASWYEHTKFYTRSDHIYQPAAIIYNKAFLDKLTPEQRTILMGNSKEVAQYGRRLIRKIDAPLIDNIKGAGIKVITLTPAQKAAFKKATKSVYKKIRKRLSKDGKKLLKLIQKQKAL
jgi:TRAP-type transport system periplasmic protein